MEHLKIQKCFQDCVKLCVKLLYEKKKINQQIIFVIQMNFTNFLVILGSFSLRALDLFRQNLAGRSIQSIR